MARAEGLSRRGFLAGLGGIALGGATLLAAGGCGYFRPGDALSRARDAGYITLGYPDIAPLSFYDQSLTGAAIAVDRAVFGKLGVPELRGVSTTLPDLVPGLIAGRFDAISGSLTITGQRCGEVAFAEPMFRNEPALMVPAGNPLRLTDYQSALAAPARVGALIGSVEAEHLSALGVANTGVGSAASALVALRDQRVDAVALDAVVLRWMRDHQADFPVEVTAPFSPVLNGVAWTGAGATAFRPADTTLLEAYNTELAKLGASEALRLTAEFGITERELPEQSMTTAALCG